MTLLLVLWFGIAPVAFAAKQEHNGDSSKTLRELLDDGYKVVAVTPNVQGTGDEGSMYLQKNVHVYRCLWRTQTLDFSMCYELDPKPTR